MARTGLAAALMVILLPLGVWPADDVCGFPAHDRVAIQRGNQVQAEFRVALADSVSRRRRGLMYCPLLDPGTGMLFVYDDVRPRVFWMKDAPLELAIIFVAADGQITAIEKGHPRSLTRIPSPGPVQYVLEINYKEAWGLQVGDRMQRMPPETQP
jgi:uncharacterized membrane protein (UPF0127 family)